MTRKICAQNTANSYQFIHFEETWEETKRYIQKSKKSQPAGFGHMYAAYLFFSLKLPIFSVPAFKFSHKSFALYFQFKIDHLPSLLYCVGVVEQG